MRVEPFALFRSVAFARGRRRGKQRVDKSHSFARPHYVGLDRHDRSAAGEGRAISEQRLNGHMERVSIAERGFRFY